MTDREKFEAWFRANEQSELRKSCAEGWAYFIWQAALASQQPADDGWIEWSGGDCPVFAYSLVETKWSSGAIVEDCAGEFDWSFEDGSCNIIAYRVVKP